MPKPIASARAVDELMDRHMASTDWPGYWRAFLLLWWPTVNTLRAEIASRLRRMERGER